MQSFRISIHVRPPGIQRGSTLSIAGREVTPLVVRQEQLSLPFSVSFELACDRLSQLPRMYCEPDGSFVWVADDNEKSWQVDGNLYDGPSGLMYVDLSGSCPANEFDHLLRCFGWPETAILFQLVQEAVSLDERDFRFVM